jgi:hypothetical protein
VGVVEHRVVRQPQRAGGRDDAPAAVAERVEERLQRHAGRLNDDPLRRLELRRDLGVHVQHQQHRRSGCGPGDLELHVVPDPQRQRPRLRGRRRRGDAGRLVPRAT